MSLHVALFRSWCEIRVAADIPAQTHLAQRLNREHILLIEMNCAFDVDAVAEI